MLLAILLISDIYFDNNRSNKTKIDPKSKIFLSEKPDRTSGGGVERREVLAVANGLFLYTLHIYETNKRRDDERVKMNFPHFS